MEWFSDRIIELSHFSRDYLSLISMALVAVLLATQGQWLFRWAGGWIHRLPKILQLPVRSVFGLLVFGAIMYFVPDWLELLLDLFNNLTLAPVLLIILLLSGVLSKRHE